jgi:adenylate cyclase
MSAPAAEPLLRDALRIVQDVVTQAKGSPLHREEMRCIEQALARLAGADAAADSGYSQREATILFADLRGFSAIAAAYPADVVLGVLSRCLGALTEIIARHYGTIDKYTGDGVMAVFHGEHGHARRALLCAVEMQLAMNELRQRQRHESMPEVYLGIGISTGKVMAGLIGSDAYRAYTVIGEEVNLAARIEAFSLRGQVLMSEATYERCRDFVEAGDCMEVYVKGKRERLRLREALAVPSLGKRVPRQDQRKSPRVEVVLEVDCLPVIGKVLQPEALRGVMRDLSYHGARVELPGALPLYSEVKLAFDLPCLGYRADFVYARVVSMRQEAGRAVAGLEFTSLDAETGDQIQLFVQMRLQGECGPLGSAPGARQAQVICRPAAP